VNLWLEVGGISVSSIVQLKTLQLHEERLLEKEAAVKQREEETQRYRSLLLAQAEEHGQLRRREVEHEYEALVSSARKDRDLLEGAQPALSPMDTALSSHSFASAVFAKSPKQPWRLHFVLNVLSACLENLTKNTGTVDRGQQPCTSKHTLLSQSYQGA
jgi:hypothetical protein